MRSTFKKLTAGVPSSVCVPLETNASRASKCDLFKEVQQPGYPENFDGQTPPTRTSDDSPTVGSKFKSFASKENSVISKEFIKEDYTCIIVDWDDTIFPSSQVSQLEGVDIFAPDARIEIARKYPDVSQDLARIDKVANQFFKKSCMLGMTTIVTNAEKGWVELSAEEFLPMTWSTMKDCGVHVISARSLYGNPSNPNPFAWKVQAFFNFLASFFDVAEMRDCMNVVSIGDSDAERAAVFKVVKELNNKAYAKSIKFIENPSCLALRLQLDYASNILKQVVDVEGRFDWLMVFDTTEQ